MNQLVHFDTTALNRALVGFDRIFDDFEHRFASQISNNYPPYNVVRYDEDNYGIELAVAGFSKDEITVQLDQNQLVVNGEHIGTEQTGIEYLHRSLAARNFTRAFALAEFIEVDGVTIKDGVLKIKLKRVIPEQLKPRMIQIKSE
jgi:molecular chaperone IbpA